MKTSLRTFSKRPAARQTVVSMLALTLAVQSFGGCRGDDGAATEAPVASSGAAVDGAGKEAEKAVEKDGKGEERAPEIDVAGNVVKTLADVSYNFKTEMGASPQRRTTNLFLSNGADTPARVVISLYTNEGTAFRTITLDLDAHSSVKSAIPWKSYLGETGTFQGSADISAPPGVSVLARHVFLNDGKIELVDEVAPAEASERLVATRFYDRMPDQSQPGQRLSSGLTITNPSGSSVRVTLAVYGENGVLLPAQPPPFDLGAHAQLRTDRARPWSCAPADATCVRTGYVEVSATGPVVASSRTYLGRGAEGQRVWSAADEQPLVRATAEQQASPSFAIGAALDGGNTAGEWSRIRIANPRRHRPGHAEEAAQVTVVVREGSKPTATYNLTIPPGELAQVHQDPWVANPCRPGAESCASLGPLRQGTRSVVVTPTNNVPVAVTNERVARREVRASAGQVAGTQTLQIREEALQLVQRAGGPVRLVSTHFARNRRAGDNLSALWSSAQLFNPSATESAEVTISFFGGEDARGTAADPAEAGGMLSRFKITVPPLGVWDPRADSALDLSVDSSVNAEVAAQTRPGWRNVPPTAWDYEVKEGTDGEVAPGTLGNALFDAYPGKAESYAWRKNASTYGWVEIAASLPLVATASVAHLDMPGSAPVRGSTMPFQHEGTIPFTSVPLATPGKEARPNIVVIEVDDLDANTFEQMLAPAAQGFYPHLTALKNRGVSFPKSYTTDPICCPSRATLFSGQYAHNTNVRRINAPYGGASFLRDNNTVATWLRGAGYRTSFVGKYLNPYGAFSSQDGKQTGHLGAGYIPPGWDAWLGLYDNNGPLGTAYSSYGWGFLAGGDLPPARMSQLSRPEQLPAWVTSDRGVIGNPNQALLNPAPGDPRPTPDQLEHTTTALRRMATDEVAFALDGWRLTAPEPRPLFLVVAPPAPHKAVDRGDEANRLQSDYHFPPAPPPAVDVSKNYRYELERANRVIPPAEHWGTLRQRPMGGGIQNLDYHGNVSLEQYPGGPAIFALPGAGGGSAQGCGGSSAAPTSAFNECNADKPGWMTEGMGTLTTPPSQEAIIAGMPPELDADDIRRLQTYQLDRLESMRGVDDLVGSVVAELSRIKRADNTTELDNTVIIFTSDNGYMLGEHRLAHKNVVYEEAVRVPLLIAAPRTAPGVSRAIALNNDLASTIAAYAGVRPGLAVDGRSLKPLVQAPMSAGSRKRFAIEGDYDPSTGPNQFIQTSCLRAVYEETSDVHRVVARHSWAKRPDLTYCRDPQGPQAPPGAPPAPAGICTETEAYDMLADGPAQVAQSDPLHARHTTFQPLIDKLVSCGRPGSGWTLPIASGVCEAVEPSTMVTGAGGSPVQRVRESCAALEDAPVTP